MASQAREPVSFIAGGDGGGRVKCGIGGTDVKNGVIASDYSLFGWRCYILLPAPTLSEGKCERVDHS